MSLHRYQFGYVDLPDPTTAAQHVLELDDAPAPVTVRLDGGLRSKLDQAAARDGVSPESWLQTAIASVLSSSRPAAAR
jgi:hypothetical protein